MYIIYLKMTEEHVAFLLKIALSLPDSKYNKTQTLMKSYYLMKCQALTKGYGLPVKHFSPKVRCLKCYIEWDRRTETNLKPIKLSKRQKKRIKSMKKAKANKEHLDSKNNLLCSNQLEQICSFCKHKNVMLLMKPEQEEMNKTPVKEENQKLNSNVQSKLQKDKAKKSQVIINNNKHNKTKFNVYNSAQEVFSLKNRNNTLASSVKVTQKVKKISKKRKDRYAGLCKEAVLASAKMKEDKQNKINLFLKPST